MRLDLIQPIAALLEERAASHSTKVALRDRAREVTYADLHRRTGNLAANLRGLGLARGDAVAFYMNNSVALLESYLGVTRAAGLGVCLSAQATEHEAAFMLGDAGARMVITDSAHLEVVRRLCRDLPSVERIVATDQAGDGELSFEGLAGQGAGTPPPDDLAPDAPAWMLYTSGTTGRPKGVLLSQHSMMWVVSAAWIPIHHMTEDDYVLSPLPLSHSYPFDGSLAVLAAGATEHILERFTTPDVVTLLQTQPVTIFWGVPTIFSYLLDAAESASFRPRTLRAAVSAGAVLPSALNERFEAAFGVPLLDAYGATEASTAITMTSPTESRVAGSCGLPVPGLAVRIVDPVTGTDRAPGEDGDLIVRGPGIMLGYHNLPEETAATLRDGWYHTGDLARFDANGFITITGRVKDLIIRGGENISPVEIERVVMGHDAVLDCAVVGQAHATLGEVPVLFVVPREGSTAFPTDDVLDHCRRNLSAFKVPAAVHVVDEIPKTGSGKVIRYRLVELLESR